MTMTTENNLYEYMQQKLKAHFQNNQDFNQDIATIFEYYKSKLVAIVKEAHHEKMEEMLFASIKSQITNGYYMGLEILNGDSQFEDDFFRQAEGMISQQIPDMLRTVTNNSIEEIITNDALRELTSWLVMEYEDVYPLLMDISLNTASLGTKWAFKDEANKRDIESYTPQFRAILANIDDVSYIDPQSFLTLIAINDNSEVWEIINSDYRGLEKIGEVTVLRMNREEEQIMYFLNVSLKNQVNTNQQESIINSVAVRLMVMNEVERMNIVITASSVVDYFQFN
ncbi:hypothetical protein [Robertmurraya sp. FSL R5-0851]|uniref:hypothetical protein n=1 Tax=Robertmurraya sp. FSL R5-0851 TaxID=2921584 RepID=UPI0030FB60D2